MIRRVFRLTVRPSQSLLFIPLGDIHWDTPECDRERLIRLVKWIQKKQAQGVKVRVVGHGDYLDFASPSERSALTTGKLHETTNLHLDKFHLSHLRELLDVLMPIRSCFLGLLSGHHYYRFITQVAGMANQGKNSDKWLAESLGCAFLGTGGSLYRMAFNHPCYGRGCHDARHLDVFSYHGSGGAQTPGGRVQKRMRFAEIAPTAHLVTTGHDNAKLVYPRSGLDFDHGRIKRYVVGTGSFQRAYLDDQEEAGYVERSGFVPADLGISLVTIQVEKRDGKWRVDYHVSV